MNALWKQLAIATNWPVLVAVAVLSTIGIISIWADTRLDPNPEWRKQVAFLVVAIVCMAVFQAVNYQKIGRYSWAFYIFSLLLIGYTLLGSVVRVPGVWKVNGAYAWINFGPASLQPAELTKIAFVMVLARYLRFRSNYRTLVGLLPPFALALIPIAMILKQPDMGTALIFIPALFAMLFVAGAKIRHLLAVVGMGLAVAPLIWFSGTDLPVFRHMPELVRTYQRERVYAMFHSDPATLQRKGFQQHHALTAFGSGGFSGKGVGNIPVGQRVPEGHNDMIFALIGEQFGFFGSAAVLLAYIVLFAAGIEIAAATREPFGKLLAIGVVSLLAGQTFLNLMVATKLMPVTGVTLPFISYGGSSLLASYMAAGLLLNIGQNRPLVMARDAFEFE
ncbi:FtsW/RodA/SpoVE family cell cycle protein [Fontivita pretiosa]|uniref:FtsW/RodA/SpoVE family cell cycle protein n=1 Tax=Fontivita pretiosa TaxID=2989684 RepID=UPI003D16E2EE